jgi:hypothetical protein
LNSALMSAGMCHLSSFVRLEMRLSNPDVEWNAVLGDIPHV